MSKTYSPERLDVAAFAHAGGTLSGAAPLAQFARVAQEVRAQTGAAPDVATPPVRWHASGHMRPVPGGGAQPMLHLDVAASVPLICQRCLQALAQPLAIERDFLFVADEETAAMLDDELDDDVLVLSNAFDLLALIEDELLLALPLVPRHEECPAPPALSSSHADFDEAATPARPNPFAVLAGLSLGDRDKNEPGATNDGQEDEKR